MHLVAEFHLVTAFGGTIVDENSVLVACHLGNRAPFNQA
jgi:hypothetical protein